MKKLLFILLVPCALQAQIDSPLSVERSQVLWEGKPLVGGGHTGTIQFVSGFLSIAADGLAAKGEFVLDMNTIKNTDIEKPESAKDLEDHLKADDFFSVEKFPKATFAILYMTPTFVFGPKQNKYTVTGLLNIKGITHTISFPAVVTQEKGEVRVDADISIDRTKWNVNYQSKSVFASLKDGIISDEITIRVKLFFGGGKGC
jgi:polyisoprenoid-binding protein YceI